MNENGHESVGMVFFRLSFQKLGGNNAYTLMSDMYVFLKIIRKSICHKLVVNLHWNR